jgi:hypothetical protein
MKIQTLNEKELIKFLKDIGALKYYINFMLQGAYPSPRFDDRSDISKIAFEIQRSELSLDSDLKPGDIDILIIPEYKGKLEFDKTMAIEVKIIRPTLNKPGKSPSSFGSQQVKGLARDGFPYCGLLHIVTAANLPINMQGKIPIMSYDLDENDEFIATGETLSTDYFGLESSIRNEGRIKKFELDNFVGYSSQSATVRIIGNKQHFELSLNSPHPPTPNPMMDPVLVNAIREHYFKNQEAYVS